MSVSTVVPAMPSPEYDRPSRFTRTGSERRATRQIAAPLAMLSFWAAIAIPAIYLPLFVLGIDTTGELLVFLALFGLHLLALIGGRYHRRSGG